MSQRLAIVWTFVSPQNSYVENVMDQCFQTVVLEKTLESPMDSKEIKPVEPKGNQPWIFIGRTDTEAEAPILWPPDAKSRLTGKDLDAGKDWGQEEKQATEVGWHYQFDGHEFEHAPGVGDGQGNLACCTPGGRRVKQYWATKLNLLQEYPLFLFRVTCWCRLIIKMPWFILSNNWYAWNHCLSFPCFSAPFLPLAYSWDFLVPINIRIETENLFQRTLQWLLSAWRGL